ncbi:hypothetical protein ES703_88907 [subsurface metagenome]
MKKMERLIIGTVLVMGGLVVILMGYAVVSLGIILL